MTGVLVIGSGAAGLQAAIAASAECETTLITDGPLGKSNTAMAQGGLQLPLPEEQSRERFVADMLASARVAVDEGRVRRFANQVNAMVGELENWGLSLDRDAGGDYVRRLAGGTSEPRIVSVRDQIGPVLMRVLRHKLDACEVEVQTHCQVESISAEGGRLVAGVRDRRGREQRIGARAIVCCTGGLTYHEAGRRCHRSTNPPNENHVLTQSLVELGLPRVHEDYFQYQPFGIVDGSGPLDKCVPESVVSFPVRLLDRHRREVGPARQDRFELTRLMFAVADRGDAVTSSSDTPGLWLTLSDLEPGQLSDAFPKTHRLLERAGLLGGDILVFPFLHYQLGGFAVGAQCETLIPGLFLAGEMVGGIHGRNRLMGNGLTDSLVHGRIAGKAAAAYANSGSSGQ